MAWLSWFERTRSTLAGLTAGAKLRAEAEAAWAETYRAEVDAAERELAKGRRQLDTREKDESARIDAEHRKQLAAIEGNAEAGRAQAAATRADETRRLLEKVTATEKDGQEKYQNRRWTLDSMLEAGEKEATDALADSQRTVTNARATLNESWDILNPLLARVKLDPEELKFPATNLPAATVTSDIEGKLEVSLEDMANSLDRATKPMALALCSPAGSALLAVVAAIVCGGVGYAAAGIQGLAVGVVVGLILGGAVLLFLLRWFVRKQVKDRVRAFGVYHAEATRAAETYEIHAKNIYENAVAELKRKHVNDHLRTDEKYLPFFEQLKTQRQEHQQTIEAAYEAETKRMLGIFVGQSRDEDVRHTAELNAFTTKLAQDRNAVETTFTTRMAKANATKESAYTSHYTKWHALVESARKELHEVKALGEAANPPYELLKTLPTTVPNGVKMGEWTVDLAAIPQGISADATLNPTEPFAITMPAMVPFPDNCSVVFKAKDEARAESVKALQALMLRFLTSLPPGKVRFTIIDPVGLGENFASFMHLADSDEQLVTGRIWTEPDHIEQRLTDLTEHMETVIQKYLRNQYKSIEEYNRAAGEVAEPYRVLVIANFPTNFSPDAAKRLISIVNSGPSCGVCTLVGVDTRAALPRDFRLADLEQPSLNFVWNNARFELRHPDLAMFPLVMDPPPAGPILTELVRRVGAASLDAARVEVPFDFIAPKPDAIWSLSASKGIDVPIGRAGATRRQHFRLGVGTAQHALVAGKTGSGKSTLLHALITNLAMHYAPGEIDLYLIDFKKGVEFKSYAQHGLPHARVVAIESEREFGLSVLQKLDLELRERGDKFRDAGTNDLAGYRESIRKKNPNANLPRVMLIIDEFQEFFVEDDKLAQEAALLLDRLVRQGRAFGIHVLLGSQTLGGAYSLARSTIDQMAVRIALQCSDTDAQLILSKDNSAARLLSRPGEAIYNDANGLVEGNDPFQVVWLDESRREKDIQDLRDRAKGYAIAPPLVFEGNAAAELNKNAKLAELFTHRPTVLPKVPVAWLGDPVAITATTSATFRAQSASNLLIMGQQEDAALAETAAVILSLGAQTPVDANEPIIFVVDGTQDDSDNAELLRKLSVMVGPTVKAIERHEIAVSLASLAALVQTRSNDPSADRSARFVVVHGLQRFRELRKPEEDFSFKRGEKTVSPGEHFAAILKDGPAAGVHVVVWVDTLTNLTRAMDRQAVKEFGHKVLFAMSPNDSSLLLDTPAAAKLGRNRALYTRDDLERPEKFRPYGLPGLDWLRGLCGASTPAGSGMVKQQATGAGLGLPT